MSTEKSIFDNFPTVLYRNDNQEPSSLLSNHHTGTDDPGESEARKLSPNASNSKKNLPEFSPSFVKIPFDDIQIGDCCGEGSFGTVYKGKWISQEKEVAVKTLNRMDEEVRILSTLSHRNIIQFYGACCEVPNCCLITEYAPYGSLYSFLASPKSELLEFSQMVTWAKDVASGMNYLHDEAPIQVVHRDLKSKNVLICNDFCLKICDFGASRVFDETTVMTITGTYPWMAPELIQGLPTSEMCDVYSFGVVLWELITKEVPFKGLQGYQVAWNVVERNERPLIPTSCPTRLAYVMQQCWHAEPTERQPFCDIVRDLNQMLIDDELEKQADSFVHTKGEWIVELQDKLMDIRKQEKKLESEKKNADKRKEIMKHWAESLENELKQKSLFNFQFNSFNCEYSETTKSSMSSVSRDAVSRLMFSSGLHRQSREEKFGMRMEAASPSNAASPLFGVSLSRQGSTSSMESSRSMSMHSDVAYDMSKVDSSPVSFMDATVTDGFPFPKVREVQAGERSRMRLQKQISASSEELQFEGVKMSRESTPSLPGNSELKGATEWESSSIMSKSNQKNGSYSSSLLNTNAISGPVGNKPNIPSVHILERALRGINWKSDSNLLAVQLHENLLLLSGTAPSTPSSSHSMSPNALSTKRSPPFILKKPKLPVVQKPPLNYSPTRVMDTDDIFNTVYSRAGKNIKSTVETQTDGSKENALSTHDANTQTVEMSERKISHYHHHVPSIERACTDAHKSGAREYVTLMLSKIHPANTSNDDARFDDSENISSGQVYNNCNALHNRPGSANGFCKPRKINYFSRSRSPKSLSMDRAMSPDTERVQSSPNHVSARQVYLAGRAQSAIEQNSNIYETDDFTYIIRPNGRRKR